MIFFNIEEVREFLIKNGFVYTLRKPRNTGQDIAVYGSYYKHKTFAKVFIDFEGADPFTPEALEYYIEKTGLYRGNKKEDSAKWLELEKKLSGEHIHLYKVSILELAK